MLTDFKLDQHCGSFGNFLLYYKNGSENILDKIINLAVAESALSLLYNSNVLVFPEMANCIGCPRCLTFGSLI